MAIDDDFDFDFDSFEDLDRDEIESIEVLFDEDGAADIYMVVDGELIDFGTLDPEEVGHILWDDLYWWADENGIDIDVEVEYA